MPFNGSGTFNRIYSWEADKAAGIDITASRMDADTNDITANGLSAVLTRDGQGAPTANLPMNNFHHTGALAAAAPGQYLTYEQLVGTGTLALKGASIVLSGDATVGGVLHTGNVTTTGNQTVSGTFASGTQTITGNSTISGTLGVTGGVTLSTFLNVAGVSFLDSIQVNASVGIGTFLNVAGTTNLSGVLNVTGSTPLSNTGPFMISTGAETAPTAWTFNCGINCANGVAAPGFMTVSDQRMKTEIEDITPADGEDWVMRGRPRKYMMNGKPSTGFIAQEDIAAGRNAAVLSIADEDPKFAEGDGYAPPGQRLIRDYLHDIAYLTAALKSALSRISALERA